MRFAIGREVYGWSMLVLWVGIRLAWEIAHALAPTLFADRPGNDLFYAFTLVTAVLTSARLADAGYQWWLGAAGIVATYFGVPNLIHDLQMELIKRDFIEASLAIRDMGRVDFMPALAFIVWATTLPPLALPKHLAESVFGDGTPPQP